jgi:hypothetical protein
MSSFPVQAVRDAAHNALGTLRTQAELQRSRERGITGWLGRFIALPYEIREASGVTSPSGRRAAFGFGVLIQGITIAVIGGLITGALLAIL